MDVAKMYNLVTTFLIMIFIAIASLYRNQKFNYTKPMLIREGNTRALD